VCNRRPKSDPAKATHRSQFLFWPRRRTVMSKDRDSTLDENDDLVLLMAQGMGRPQLLEEAKRLGWNEADRFDLGMFYDANTLLCQQKPFEARELLAVLKGSENYYVRYYSEIFYNAANGFIVSEQGDNELTQRAETLLDDLAAHVTSETTYQPFDAACWLITAARLAMCMHYVNKPRIRWSALRESVLGILERVESKPHALVNSPELQWLLWHLARSQDDELEQAATRVATLFAIDLDKPVGLFP